jgi:hypothetical protein
MGAWPKRLIRSARAKRLQGFRTALLFGYGDSTSRE